MYYELCLGLDSGINFGVISVHGIESAILKSGNSLLE